ncbi:MAG: helix-turn-helix domain-containing protein [Candidatus Anammoximicrobium sp.]|nr:helix-turn-helix domain-containing protein [Candidatus Anammoximicrobium sp.]
MILELLALVGGCATAIGFIEAAVGIRDEIRWQKNLTADGDGEQDDFGPGERPPATPFPSERKLGGGGLTLKQQQAIHRLDQQGISAAEIAREVGCATATVYRHWGRGGNHAMLPNSLADKRKKVGPNVTPS